MSNVINSHRQNLALSRLPSFVANMSRFINAYGLAVVRVHAAGDFYSVAYVRKWLAIVRACPDTQFFAYTRSWRVTERCSPALVKAVYELSLEPNMRIWLSCDRETGMPPSWPRSPWAYLMLNDDDIPSYPVELVFRDDAKTVMRREPGNDSLVCPYEQGISQAKHKCSSCQICYNPSRPVLQRFSKLMISLAASIPPQPAELETETV